MRPAITPFIPEDIDLAEWSEGDQLKIAVGVLWQATQDSVHYSLEHRKQTDAELAEYRRSRRTLTLDEVTALVEGDENAWQSL
jgi:hypothetical protein